MGFPGRFEPRRALAAALSAAFHLGLFLVVILAGGRHDGTQNGETASTQLVLIEAPNADHREGVDLTPIEPTVAKTEIEEQVPDAIEPPASVTAEAIATDPTDDAQLLPPDEPPAATEAVADNAINPEAMYVMSQAEKSALSQRLEQLAEQLAKESRAQVAWEQDGKRYSAVLIQERANDGTALEHVIAEVSAADRGRKMSTRIALKRLAFSQFSQIVDRWDPMVQLHDDVIVGRFHSNSRFNVLYDSRTAPQFLGKVTTAGRDFDMRSIGSKMESNIFRNGIQTRTGRIPLPEELQPSEWAPPDPNARIHELNDDTHIKFFADGSYAWRTDGAPPRYLNDLSEHPVYFIGTGAATVYVKGIVAGKILIYSPQKIIVEGSLTYAHDPREVPDSRDYLGLVSDKYIEIASPGVTGPGDLEIQAALFAGRRFVVRDTEHHRSATLRIYGSLAAGSLSASEPRYATKIEYDERFERHRPPGFPSTNRYEIGDWDGKWTQTPERSAGDAIQ